MLRQTITSAGLPAPVIAVPNDVLSTTLQISRFDPALGFLTSAQIRFAGQVQSDVWLAALNPSLPTQPVGLAQLLSVTVFSAGQNAPGFQTTPLSIEAEDQGQIPSAGFLNITLYNEGMTALVPMTQIAAGVGTGTFTVNASWAGQFQAFPTGGQSDGGGRLFFAAEVHWSYLAFEDARRGTSASETLNALATGSIVYGDAGNDVINGSAVEDVLFGDAGNDTLLGGGGNDTLFGGLGRDRLEGAAGDDLLFAGGSADTLLGGDGNDELHGEAGTDFLDGGAGDDILYGGTGADSLLGGAGRDRLLGGSGADTLDGGGSNDTLEGGSGRDLLFGGAGSDLLNGGSENDTLYGGSGSDTLIGASGNDLLDGGTGDDVLDGGSGVDTLTGGGGSDTLTGGGGADVFVFADGFGTDSVTDFQNGSDRFDFRAHSASSFAQLTVANSGGNATISDGLGNTILVQGAAGLIDAGDFIF